MDDLRVLVCIAFLDITYSSQEKGRCAIPLTQAVDEVTVRHTPPCDRDHS